MLEGRHAWFDDRSLEPIHCRPAPAEVWFIDIAAALSSSVVLSKAGLYCIPSQ
jgi:hypothetical protein